MTFEDLKLIPPLLRAVAEAGYENPSPIQEKGIAPVLAGRDLMACAQTGTGKTAAFALPILQLLQARGTPHVPKGSATQGRDKRPIRTLILTPTRELALQIFENFEIYGKYLKLRSAVIFGGVGQNPQVAALRKGVDILVATPGRLNDLIGQGFIKLSQLEIFVLDEADRMLDMGFVHDVRRVLALLPEKRQTLLFSATMPKEIVSLAEGMLKNPTQVFVTPVSSTVETIEQQLYKIDRANKRYLLASLLKKNVKSALVFTRTKHGADKVVRELGKDNILAKAIHGNKSQTARQDALTQLKDGRVKVLVATDIAARGLDINELSHVINYDLPNIPETYVHRIGRTGRAGHGGVAISFCDVSELPFLADIEKLIGFAVNEVENHEWPMQEGNIIAKKPVPAQSKPQQTEKTTKAKQKTPKASQPTAKEQAPTPKIPAAPKPTATKSSPPKNSPSKPQVSTVQKTKKRHLPPPFDPYENLKGGKAIITKKPIWGAPPDDLMPQTTAAAPKQTKGETDEMSRPKNNNKNYSKNRTKQAEEKAFAAPVKPVKTLKDANGVFRISEQELEADKSIRVINPGAEGDNKFASFEDYLNSANS
jgi:ATP-dependent RNA helicase RhlE